jgi:dethiobiotin synthetase
MSFETWFVTGSSTGAGKTVLTVLLARYLRRIRRDVRAVKPICSGGREDAQALHHAQDAEVSLEDINPWFFDAPIAPNLAARREGRMVHLDPVLEFLRGSQKNGRILLIEGAGGLLSPLGEGFDSLDVIQRLGAIPLVACPNQLGVINQARLVLAALPPEFRPSARIALVHCREPDASVEGNRALLEEYFDPNRIVEIPWIPGYLSDGFPVALEPILHPWLEPLLSPVPLR